MRGVVASFLPPRPCISCIGRKRIRRCVVRLLLARVTMVFPQQPAKAAGGPSCRDGPTILGILDAYHSAPGWESYCHNTRDWSMSQLRGRVLGLHGPWNRKLSCRNGMELGIMSMFVSDHASRGPTWSGIRTVAVTCKCSWSCTLSIVVSQHLQLLNPISLPVP